jgi:CubicO group peptidase (beta-lactamase class C family)
MLRKDFLFRCAHLCALPALVYSNPPYRGLDNRSDEPLSRDLENLIPKIMKSANIPGSSLAIIRNGKLSWVKGYGVKDRISNDPVTVDTVFEIASVSKTVFAYAVMKLCEKGILGLDVPLVKYVLKPLFEGDPWVEQITARHVLSHTTGLQNWRTPDEPLKIHFPPGSDFMYSGEGYYYLQSVVTQLTGKVDHTQCGSYEAALKVCATDIGEYMTENVLVPNEMSSSGYVWTPNIGKKEALPHGTNGKLISKPHQTAIDMARYASSGGLLATANDYAHFVTSLFNPKENHPFLLNKDSVNTMVTPQIKLPKDQKIDGADYWALGWAIKERTNGNLILHSGGQSGFKSLAVASLERKAGFVILTNSDNGGYIAYDPEIRNVLDRLFI